MNVIVGVCVYDRIVNIQRWIKAWEKSDKFDAKLVICHNLKDNFLSEELIAKCDYYIPRNNTGFDLGFFKDIVNKKYLDNINWDVLVWFTDDFIPMKKDFLKPFLEKISNNDVGLVGACFEPSNQNNLYHHFRTNGFAIKKNTADKLKFPKQILNRKDCFDLEHGSNNITIQIENIGLKCVPAIGNVYPKEGYSHWPNNNFMVDTGHPITNFDWQSKFEEEFA